jgi:hypothetical protein
VGVGVGVRVGGGVHCARVASASSESRGVDLFRSAVCPRQFTPLVLWQRPQSERAPGAVVGSGCRNGRFVGMCKCTC